MTDRAFLTNVSSPLCVASAVFFAALTISFSDMARLAPLNMSGPVRQEPEGSVVRPCYHASGPPGRRPSGIVILPSVSPSTLSEYSL